MRELSSLQSVVKSRDITIVLSQRDHTHLGALVNIPTDSIKIHQSLTNGLEVSFDVHHQLNEHVEVLWDKIISLKYIYIPELKDYLEIEVTDKDGYDTIKSVTAVSAGIAELSQTLLFGLEINTDSDIARDDYVVTTFYNADHPESSMLHRILSIAPQYTVNHVDTPLWNIQRTLSADNKSIWDFFIGDVADQFKCMFEVDNVNRQINVYDLYTTCRTCHYRGEFIDTCPDCGGHDLIYFGKDTSVYIDKENLASSIDLTVDSDSIKNTLRLVGGDDLMTATIRSLNPNGSAYITKFNPDFYDDMPQELVNKLISYNNLYTSKMSEYQTIVENMYDAIDKITEYQSTMMPTRETGDINATTEAVKLNQTSIGNIAMKYLSTSTSIAVVRSALQQYARSIVKSGYVKVEIDAGDTWSGRQNGPSYYYGTWNGRFKITNYSDKDDIAYSSYLSITITDQYESFLRQRIEKHIGTANNKVEDGSVFEVLKISDLNQFKATLKLYCMSRLKSFYDAIQGVLDILTEEDQATITEGKKLDPSGRTITYRLTGDFYETLYKPYWNKSQAVQAEIDARQKQIDAKQKEYDTYYNQMVDIHKLLNFQNYLGDDLFKLYCDYRREDTYQNSNFTTKGLNNAEIFERAREFLKLANKELDRATTPQYSISADINNFLLMDEFQPIVEDMKIGNWIRMGVDGDLFRLRLIECESDLSNNQELNLVFSDVTKYANVVSDVNSLLNSMQSMATNFDYVAQQASDGKVSMDYMKMWLDEGLSAALARILSNDNEELIIDNNGLLARTYDDIENGYSPAQLRITHNLICFTNDDWETVITALGDIIYTDCVSDNKPATDPYRNGYIETKQIRKVSTYGLLAQAVIAGWIQSSTIVGSEFWGVDKTRGVLNGFRVDNEGNITGGHITGTTFKNGDRSFVVTKSGKIAATSAMLCAVGERPFPIDANLDDIPLLGNGDIFFSGNINNNNFRVTKNGDAWFKGTISASSYTSNNQSFIVTENGKLKCTAALIGEFGNNEYPIYWDHVETNPNPNRLGYPWNRSNPNKPTDIGNLNFGDVRFRGTISNDNFIVTKNGNVNMGGILEMRRNYSDGSEPVIHMLSDGLNNDATINRREILLNGGSVSLDMNHLSLNGANTHISSQGMKCGPWLIQTDKIIIPGEIHSGSGAAHMGSDGAINGTYLGSTGSAQINGNLQVGTINGESPRFCSCGSKMRIINTPNYGVRSLYCLETPTPTFSDMGDCQLDNDGICYVYIDDIFSETVNTSISYQVQLQKYGKGDCWVSRREPNYFVIEGTPNLNVGWVIHMVQFDSDTLRLEVYDEEESMHPTNYTKDNENDIFEYIYKDISSVSTEQEEDDILNYINNLVG